MATTASTDHDHDHDHDHEHAEYTTAMMYGYGTASVTIISCAAILGIVLFPSLKSRSRDYFLQLVIALGVGTLTADALIHIIPQVLGLHAHEEEEHAHEEEEVTDPSINTWKMSVVYGGIFVFFLLENGLKAWKRRQSANAYPVVENNGQTHTVTTFTNIHADKNGVAENEVRTDVQTKNSTFEEESVSSFNDNKVCWKFTTTLLTVFIGDVLHNIADGLAIGVSFSSSATSGVATSIAVLCHEIPHELGDFAIYLNNGLSKWQAIGLNVVAACSAFVGLYTGTALGQNDAVRQWLLALVAGMFLYIALVQVMDELVSQSTPKPILQFSLQVFGMVLGWTFMLLLGLYEESIEASLG